MRVLMVVKREYTREYTPSNKLNLLQYSNKSITNTLIRVPYEYSYTLYRNHFIKIRH